jgi:hypothetical protein
MLTHEPWQPPEEGNADLAGRRYLEVHRGSKKLDKEHSINKI